MRCSHRSSGEVIELPPQALDSGSFRHRLIWQTTCEGVLDQYNQPVGSWIAQGTFWGRVEPLTGRELVNAHQIKATASHKISMRNVGPIKPSDRLIFVTMPTPRPVSGAYLTGGLGIGMGRSRLLTGGLGTASRSCEPSSGLFTGGLGGSNLTTGGLVNSGCEVVPIGSRIFGIESVIRIDEISAYLSILATELKDPQ